MTSKVSELPDAMQIGEQHEYVLAKIREVATELQSELKTKAALEVVEQSQEQLLSTVEKSHG